MSDPIAYFISFTCYGTRLHGDDRGSVDRDHNAYGAPLLPTSANRVAARRAALARPPYSLDGDRPGVVRDAIVALADKRGWTLWAAHVRTQHLHVVVTAPDIEIERVMTDLKAAASFRLNREYPADRGRTFWTRHGSTRYVWKRTNWPRRSSTC
ncbi:MAG TPA: transposase [Gemmataceae bacterium]|nr:transposase [Gemmataceae bacterium]